MTALQDPGPRLAPYRVERPTGPIELWLDGNEGPRLDAAALARLRSPEVEDLRRYPDAAPLESTLASAFGRPPTEVLVTAGIDDGLDRACRAFLGSGKELVLPTPTFVMLPRYARLAGATLREIPWTAGPYPTEAVLERIGPRTGAVAVVTPNNPTGCTADRADIRRIAERCVDVGAVLLLDLAYVEYAREDPTVPLADLPSVVTFRTFSKARGLAGLRVGFALGASELCERMRAVGAPYPVSGPSLILARQRWLEGTEELEGHLAQVRSERERLGRHLRERGFAVPEGEGNFVYLPSPGAPELFGSLAKQGVAVRLFPASGNRPAALRITCPGRESEFQRLRGALATGLDALDSQTDPRRPLAQGMEPR